MTTEAGSGAKAVLAIMPYCSNVDRVRVPEQPPASYVDLVADEDIRLTTYSATVTDAAAAYMGDHAQILTPGEHTFGAGRRSTSSLMQERLRRVHGLGHLIIEAEPTNANNTFAQLRWLREWQQSQQKQQIEPSRLCIVAINQHIPRIRIGADMLKMDYETVAVQDLQLLPEQKSVIATFEEGNAAYEKRALEFAQKTAKLGPPIMSRVFDTLTTMRSPNIVDFRLGLDGSRLHYVTSARARVKDLLVQSLEFPG